MTAKQRLVMLRYGLAVASTVAAAAARWLLDPVFEDRLPFITFFAAIALTAYFGGFGPAVVSVVLCGLVADYLFLSPRHAWFPQTLDAWAAVGLFTFVGLTMAALSNVMHRARHAAELSAADCERERERFRITLASITDAVMVTDPDGRITFLNPAAEQLTGWDLLSAAGARLDEIFQIVQEETRQRVEYPIVPVLREG
ncbi:MAG: DUF4118 domain-containing protein, partial [Planctomycetia bacterium]|nr:DUF4118 domain-containing protein [Planctomycetia bacterium]